MNQLYALIENGEITRINISLPTNVNGVSIPRGAEDVEQFGLYLITGDEPAYNPDTQRIAGPQYVLTGNVVERVYSVEEIPASETHARVWESIKTERDRRRFDGGVKVDSHWFLSTPITTSEYNSLLLISAGYPDTTVLRAAWRTMGGTTIDMTPVLARSVLSAGLAQVAAIDDAAQAHRVAMEASANPAAYDFSQGWPLVYGE